MGLLLVLIAALIVGAIVFGVAVLITGDDPGIEGHEPDGRAIPLPATRPLAETDVSQVRFDTAIRGYRMSQVDSAFRRAAYDIGYKEELIQVLEAEVSALREGRADDAEALRLAREAAVQGASSHPAPLQIDLSAEPSDDEADGDARAEAEVEAEADDAAGQAKRDSSAVAQ
jgi:DivIVA domain-containing protein